jgi:S-methylmethionine-dependent homocysteine/selenocysteine methylase
MTAAAEVFQRLADGEVIVIDGGTGTELQALGVPMDEATWSGRANLDHLDMVQSLHESYARAGAQVLIANTFAASRAALGPAGLGDRVADANRNAIAAAQRARAAAGGRPVAVAGSMSSFCLIAMAGRGDEASQDDASDAGAEDPRFPSRADFAEQAALLAEAGADLIALELMESSGYGRAALDAATSTGLPVWLGISPIRHDDGTLISDPELGHGESFEDLVANLVRPGLAAVNIMHAKASTVSDAIDIIRKHYDGPIGVYAESGDWAPPDWVFNGLNPQEYLREASGWVAQGAQIVGGCCGIRPDHIQALTDGLPRRAG